MTDPIPQEFINPAPPEPTPEVPPTVGPDEDPEPNETQPEVDE